MIRPGKYVVDEAGQRMCVLATREKTVLRGSEKTTERWHTCIRYVLDSFLVDDFPESALKLAPPKARMTDAPHPPPDLGPLY